MADCWDHGAWSVNFRRSLSSREGESWEELLDLLPSTDLDQEARDDVIWSLDCSKSFTTKSLYRFRTHRGVCISASQDVWRTKLPLKIKIFFWQLQHNKLQVAASLKKRGWTGEIYCRLCGEVETTNHVFFGCSVARFTWCCLRDTFDWAERPSNLGDVLGDKFLGVMKIPAHLKLFVIAGITWAIWRSRNKMAIEKLFPKNLLDVIRSGVAFVQKWHLLLGKS